MKRRMTISCFALLSSLFCSPAVAAEVVSAAEVEWEQLNPARGDRSPKAATLWGDRKANVSTGFLVQFADGFSSPPHIHNVSYRGVVIDGLVHNDDPDAASMWMPAGSFWTQPKGEVHITAARGETNIAYIEIEEGPYLVLPVEEAFDSGERPVNVDASNLVWVDLPGMPASAGAVQRAYLWGSPKEGLLSGSMIRLSAGFTGELKADGLIFHGVLIQGQLKYQSPGEMIFEPGSYFSSEGVMAHSLACIESEECVIYVQTNGALSLKSKL